MWKSDGTEGGTKQVKDINTHGSSSPGNLINFNGTLFFTARDNSNGRELWKTDGTTTVLVKNIAPGSQSSNPGDFAVANNTLFFSAETPTYGRELWKSNGTDGGTVMVKDIEFKEFYSSDPTELIGVDNMLYFNAFTADYGYEIWKSDGTDAGTVLEKDILQGSKGFNPSNMATVNNSVFFSINGSNGEELWKSDGTEAGTTLVKNITSYVDGPTASDFFGYKNALYFKKFDEDNDYELWKSDGTEAGTAMLKNISIYGSSDIRDFKIANDTLYFVASDDDHGTELWKTNGENSGTVLVKDINLSGNSNPSNLISFKKALYFIANDGENGIELWKTDSTGTRMLKDINTNPYTGSDIDYLTVANDTLFFVANDGIHGSELWKTDGTEEGTTLVKDMVSGGDNSEIFDFIGTGKALYFIRHVGDYELWKADSTGIGKVKTINYPTNLSVVNDTLYFTDTPNNYWELWKTDGTEAGTVMLKEFQYEYYPSIQEMTSSNGKLYFVLQDYSGTSDYGSELWQSDGTTDGTKIVKDIKPGTNGSYPQKLIDANGKLYFMATAEADDVIYGQELWSLGNCTDTNLMVSKTGQSSTFNTGTKNTTTTCNCDIFNKIISTTQATGVKPISETIHAKEWIEETVPGTFVKRHYEINPASGDTTVTGKVTLYFTQADLDAYNAATLFTKLPTDSSDIAAIARIRIEKRTGTSNNDTGLPDSYTGGISIINPEDTDIVWNTSAKRWEISFENKGFGAFFMKSLLVIDPTNVSTSLSVVCSGNPVLLKATCAAGTITWYNQASGGTSIGTGNNLSQSPSATTTYYTACENGSSVSNRVATSQVLVNPTPGLPTRVLVNKTAICSGTNVSLTGACGAGVLKWYNQNTGGTSIGSGDSLSISPAVNTIYYAACETAYCSSSRVATNQVVITAQPTIPTGVSINKAVICSGATITLSASCSIGNVIWYISATGGKENVVPSIGTGNSLTLSPEVTGTYIAECKNGICTSERVLTDILTVKPTPVKPVISGNNDVCAGENTLLSAISNNNDSSVQPNFHWTGGLTGQLVTVSPANSKSYKVMASFNGCNSDSSDVFYINVTAKPIASIIANNQTICKGDFSLLTGQCASVADAFYWSTEQSTLTNVNPNPLNKVTRIVNAPGTYKGFCQSDNGCISTEVSITITQSGSCGSQGFISITPDKPVICPGTSVTLTANNCSGNITWYGGPTNQTGSSITVNPSVSTTYIAQCSAGGVATVDVNLVANNASMSTNVITGTTLIKAQNTIDANKKIGDPGYSPSANVSFEAGKSIILNPGFMAEYRSTFKAEIKACN